MKGNVNEGGIRVPTIASWPKRIEAGTSSDHPSIFYDYFATVCDVIGAEIDYKIDGESYLPALTGEEQKKHDYLYWEFPAYTGQQAIRVDKWKGYKKKLFEGPSRLKLFNIQEDPKELNDLSDNYPDVVKKLESLMKSAHTKATIEKFNIPILDQY